MTGHKATIGIDFDNTLVSYDAVFHGAFTERGLLDPTFPVSKQAIRDHLRAEGKEDLWTEMQGYVYGVKIAEANPFAGVIEALQQLCDKGYRVVIISHKTRHPYAGQQYDLHAAAKAWLAAYQLPHHDAFFEPTLEEKLARIDQQECSAFIDDLPEVLLHPQFPSAVRPILFSEPHTKVSLSFSRWSDLSQLPVTP